MGSWSKYYQNGKEVMQVRPLNTNIRPIDFEFKINGVKANISGSQIKDLIIYLIKISFT
jgi:hypothetical protein